MVFYRYTYIHRNGKICNQECYYSKRCHIYRNSPSQVSYNECGELIYGRYRFCNIHIRKHCKKEQYHQKKLAKITSAEILVGNLEVNKNDTT